MRGGHLAILVLVLGAWAVVLVAVLVHGGNAPGWLEAASGFLGSCPHRAITGEACSLCGTTTAAMLLLGGELTASVSRNPLALGLLVLGITQPVYRLARSLRPRFAWREELVIGGVGVGWLFGVIALAA